MKLNQDAVREILLYIEQKANYIDENSDLPSQHIEFPQGKLVTDEYFQKFKTSEVSYTSELLIKEGYISTIGCVKYDSNGNLMLARINGLTWKGHELLDNIRKPEIWDAVKKKAKIFGGLSISALSVAGTNVANAMMSDPNAINNFLKSIENIKEILP